MSFDTYIYIEANEFPEDAWKQACDEFGLVENSSKKFYVDVHDSFGLKVSHSALAESHIHSNNYKWVISCNINNGTDVRSCWSLFSFPYYCMSYMSGVKFHEPRKDQWVSSLVDLEALAKEYLLGFSTIHKLENLGLLNDKDEIVLCR